jgi:hypothetical protein
MRAHTEGKCEMGRRFASVIGVAAAGVMALGAQTALAAGEPVDSTPPDIQLSGKKKQELGKVVKVKASCGDEACQADVEVVLHGSGHPGQWRQTSKWHLGFPSYANADLGPGETTTLELPLNSFQRRKAGKFLDDGKNVQAKVTIEATDAAGSVATAKRTIRLVK